MDNELADSLIGQIGDAILNDPAIVNNDWDSISFVAVLEEPMSIFGFRYFGDEFHPTTPFTVELIALLRDLQVATSDEGHPTWGACLIQIDGKALDFQIDFEHENPEKWRLTPENYKTLPVQLKPTFAR